MMCLSASEFVFNFLSPTSPSVFVYLSLVCLFFSDSQRSIFIEETQLDDPHDDGGDEYESSSNSTSGGGARRNFIRLPKHPLVDLDGNRVSADGYVVQRHTTVLATRFVLLDFNDVSGQ